MENNPAKNVRNHPEPPILNYYEEASIKALGLDIPTYKKICIALNLQPSPEDLEEIISQLGVEELSKLINADINLNPEQIITEDFIEQINAEWNKIEQKIDHIDEMIKRQPDNAKLYYARACVQEKGVHDTEDILHDVERALEIDSSNPRYLRKAAELLHEMNWFRESLNYLYIIREDKSYTGDMKTDNLYGSGLIETGRYEDAIEVLEEAAKRYPSSTEVMFNLGCALFFNGQYSEALDIFEAGAKENNKQEFYIMSSIVSGYTGDNERAIEMASKVIEQDPDNYIAWLIENMADRGLFEGLESKNIYKRDEHADSANAYIVKSMISCMRGRYISAMLYVDIASEMDAPFKGAQSHNMTNYIMNKM